MDFGQFHGPPGQPHVHYFLRGASAAADYLQRVNAEIQEVHDVARAAPVLLEG